MWFKEVKKKTLLSIYLYIYIYMYVCMFRAGPDNMNNVVCVCDL